MRSLRVAVVRGGPSDEYEVSMKSGKAVLEALSDQHKMTDIIIDRDGTWYHHGAPIRLSSLQSKIDVVFNALHGTYGEDGEIQKMLESFSMPYTGSEVFPSRASMNKKMAKSVFKSVGLKTPYGITIKKGESYEEAARKLFMSVPLPIVIKPVQSGSSVGVRIVSSWGEMLAALEEGLEAFPELLVEECIRGKEATCGVVEGLRNHELYACPVTEIRPPAANSFFDYEAKYGFETEKVCPGCFSAEEKLQLEDMARKAHKALGLRHYSRSDFIVTPKRGIFILETNSLPGLTHTSLLPHSLKAVGVDLKEFLNHTLDLAMRRKTG